MAENDIPVLPNNIVADLSKDVYKDVAHPALEQVGIIGESIMKFVALPFKFLGLSADQLEEKYYIFLKKTMAKTSENRRVIPQAVVVAPLLDHVKFVFSEDGLTEMFSNLLANAMSQNIEQMVHPAFVEMLKQMSPIDAEFMSIYFSKNELIELSDINWARGSEQKSLTVDSLTRLGIVNQITYDNRDDIALSLSSFGLLFRNMCLMTPAEIERDNKHEDSASNDGDKLISSKELGFLFQDSFATARSSKTSGRLFLRESFQIEDVRNGSHVVLFIRINNIANNSRIINSLYIECYNQKHILSDFPTKFPVKIDSGKYIDFVFFASSDNNLLEYAVKNDTKYVFQIGSQVYEMPVSSNTKKEISLFLEHYLTEGGELNG